MLNFTAQGIKTPNWVTQQKFISNLTKKNSSLSCKTFSQVLERKYETDSKTTENWIFKSSWNLRLTPLFIVFRGCLSNKEINCKTIKLQKKRKQNKITHKLGEITYLILGKKSGNLLWFLGKEFGFSTNGDTCQSVVGGKEWFATCRARNGEACWRLETAGTRGSQVARAEEAAGLAAQVRDPREERVGTRWMARVYGTRSLDSCVPVTRAAWSGEGWRAGAHAGIGLWLWLTRLSLHGSTWWLRFVENMAFMASSCVAFHTAFYL